MIPQEYPQKALGPAGEKDLGMKDPNCWNKLITKQPNNMRKKDLQTNYHAQGHYKNNTKSDLIL